MIYICNCNETIHCFFNMHENNLNLFISAIAHEVAEQLKGSFQLSDSVKESREEQMTAKQVCDYLNIAHSTLWRWEREGYITPIRFGSRKRFNRSEVERVAKAERKEVANG